MHIQSVPVKGGANHLGKPIDFRSCRGIYRSAFVDNCLKWATYDARADDIGERCSDMRTTTFNNQNSENYHLCCLLCGQLPLTALVSLGDCSSMPIDHGGWAGTAHVSIMCSRSSFDSGHMQFTYVAEVVQGLL